MARAGRIANPSYSAGQTRTVGTYMEEMPTAGGYLPSPPVHRHHRRGRGLHSSTSELNQSRF